MTMDTSYYIILLLYDYYDEAIIRFDDMVGQSPKIDMDSFVS